MFTLWFLLWPICECSAASLEKAPKVVISEDIQLTQLTDNVWIHTTSIDYPGYGRVPANGLLIVDEKTAALIDTPWTNEQTGVIFDWVKDHFNVTIEHVIVTHSHDDCMGGLAEVHQRNAFSYALDLTRNIAEKEGKPLPQTTFSDSFTLELRKTTLLVKYFGGGHTIDNIVVWLPEHNILFGGCLVKSLSSKSLGNIKEADVEAWPNTLQKLLDAFPSAEIVVPGHGTHGGKRLIAHTINLCEMHLKKLSNQ
jgi:metallo-beta-lactamase class B